MMKHNDEIEMAKSNKKAEKSNFSEMINRAELSKKANKKAKKVKNLKKSNKKLKQLAAIAEKPIKSYTKTGKPSIYSEEERNHFQARIENEKKNILRSCKADAQAIIDFCDENVADEKNAAVRFARRDMRTKAVERLESNYYL